MERTELKAWLRLTLTARVGNDTARKLLTVFGSAEAVFEQSEAALRQLGSNKLVHAITTEPPKLAALLQATVDWLAGGVDRVVAPIGSAQYPAALLNIEDPPMLLYMMGSQVNKTTSHSTAATHDVAMTLAIVGSRNPTPQGEVNARQFAKAFAEQGLCIVSGLALGVDGAAHDGALLGGGTTVAVVGTGLDRVYPKKHLALAHRIAANGLLISEFPIGTPPIHANFPKRNRIISGLSSGTLVVEAAFRSGSLITARLAIEQGKDVFAIPGSIHSPQSRGCHYLIKQGAKLVETAQDVMEELKIPHALIAPVPEGDDEALEGLSSLSPEGDASLLSALGFDIVSLDALQARTGWPTPALQAKLLELELDGFIKRLPGGLFQRLAQA